MVKEAGIVLQSSKKSSNVILFIPKPRIGPFSHGARQHSNISAREQGYASLAILFTT